MTTQAVLAPHEQSISPAAPQWALTTRIAFRFCVIYFTLYCLFNQILTSLIPLPPTIDIDIPDLSAHAPTRQIVGWTAKHILRVHDPAVPTVSGSGDKMFDYVLAFCTLLFAVLGTALWSALDRRRPNYATLQKWFRLGVRFALAGQMIVYGASKAIPLQMPFPYLAKLIEPIGNLSPMGMLWTSIGASPAYERFAGCAELFGGILLLIPATTTLGALVCLADMTQVWILNMTYDVPVKLLSFHLILLSLFLLAPKLRRLADFFLLNRAVPAEPATPLFRSARKNRIALWAQLAFGAALLGTNLWGVVAAESKYGYAAPRSPLYGIWNVDTISVDGEAPHGPVSTNNFPWKRIIFEFPKATGVQRLDDSMQDFQTKLDDHATKLALTKFGDEKWKADLAIARPQPGTMTMDGTVDGHKLHFDLKLMDRSKFTIVSRGFHWIQENPYNK
jgi:uncharacterized membrane protein YphA (DoxX/SURF4 family)